MSTPVSADRLIQAITALPWRAFRPLERFLAVEARAATVLLAAAVVAFGLANSPWSAAFEALWTAPVRLQAGPWQLAGDARMWINDLGMAAFFVLVGLEIKREVLVGELNTARKAALPLIAAIGGMLVPASLYALIAGGVAPSGWGIPMATDIAFAVGAARLLGKGVPTALMVFLTAFAIADDLGAIGVIALFYGHDVHAGALLAAAAMTGVLAAMNRLGVRLASAYVLAGLPLWLAVHHSGLHATLAGVIVGLSVPAALGDRKAALAHAGAVVQAAGQPAEDGEGALEAIEHHVDAAQSPLSNLEHGMHPYVAYGVLPLFALANAGVDVRGIGASAAFDPVTLGVVAGLVLGKPLGIVAAAALAVRLRLAERPVGVSWPHLVGAGALGGIGFTMALFMTGLAFEGDPVASASAKLGVLVASTLAGLLGLALLGRAGVRRVSRSDSGARGRIRVSG